MRDPQPKHPDTCVHPRTGEWLPPTFDACLAELESLMTQADAEKSLLLFRGHADRHWRLDSTFVREAKRRLFRIAPTDGFSQHLQASGDLNATLTGLFLLKFGGLLGLSDELLKTEREHEVDAWFELMKRYQQYPNEDMLQFPGTNLLDWSRSRDVALYFANEARTAQGAIFVCDATATGKTLQVLPVVDILAKLRERMYAGLANGIPLLFAPKKQIAYARAKNQEAVYFAQMELRIDLAEQWRLQEQAQPGTTILVKLVLPADSTAACASYLASRGITRQHIFPDLDAIGSATSREA